MSPQLWLGLQMDYDLNVTFENLDRRLKKEVKPRATKDVKEPYGGMTA